MITRIPEKAATRKAALKKSGAEQAPKTRHLPPKVRLALADFQRQIINLFPDDILTIILYGSYARGDAKSDSSAYYAMFYASCAALLSKDLYLVKHQAAIDKFGELFIKPGVVDKKFSDYLKGAKEKREQSDYEPYDPVSREDTEKVLADAEAFIAKVQEILSASDA